MIIMLSFVLFLQFVNFRFLQLLNCSQMRMSLAVFLFIPFIGSVSCLSSLAVYNLKEIRFAADCHWESGQWAESLLATPEPPTLPRSLMDLQDSLEALAAWPIKSRHQPFIWLMSSQNWSLPVPRP